MFVFLAWKNMFLQVFSNFVIIYDAEEGGDVSSLKSVLDLSLYPPIYQVWYQRAGGGFRQGEEPHGARDEWGASWPAGARIVLLYQQVKISCYSKDQLSPRNAAYHLTCSAQSPQSPSLPTFVLSDNDFKVIHARSVVVKVRLKLRHPTKR